MLSEAAGGPGDARPPDCEVSVRIGPRARNVRLLLSPRDGLVVVVPPGFDHDRIPAILAGKRAWIERTWRRMERRRPATNGRAGRPDRLVLPATGEEWEIEYRPGPVDAAPAGVRIRAVSSCLVLTGAVGDDEACRRALVRWLGRRARTALLPLLSALAAQHGFAFERMAIRHQRSRWGSCSSRNTISLNLRLLFLPPDLVDHVLLHELCHTLEMNHSARFWRLLTAHDGECARNRRRLRLAGDLVPVWLNPPRPGPSVPSAIPWENL